MDQLLTSKGMILRHLVQLEQAVTNPKSSEVIQKTRRGGNDRCNKINGRINGPVKAPLTNRRQGAIMSAQQCAKSLKTTENKTTCIPYYVVALLFHLMGCTRQDLIYKTLGCLVGIKKNLCCQELPES